MLPQHLVLLDATLLTLFKKRISVSRAAATTEPLWPFTRDHFLSRHAGSSCLSAAHRLGFMLSGLRSRRKKKKRKRDVSLQPRKYMKARSWLHRDVGVPQRKKKKNVGLAAVHDGDPNEITTILSVELTIQYPTLLVKKCEPIFSFFQSPQALKLQDYSIE